MNALRIALSNELLKQKGTATVDAALFLPAVIVLFFTAYLALGAETFSSSANPWLHYYGYCLYILAVVYPLLAAFLGYSIQDLEFRSSGYVRAFLFPVPKMTLFAAKILLLALSLAFSLLLCFFTILLSGHLLDVLEPRFGFRDFNSLPVIAAYLVRFFPFLLLFSTIHFALGFISKNLLVSFGVAIALLVFGVFAGISQDYFWLFPGSWLRNALYAEGYALKQVWTPWFQTDCLWAILSLALAALLFVRTRNFE